MRTPALILLLLLMLAPRLNAALPHALACADPRSAPAGAVVAVDHHNQQMMSMAATDVGTGDTGDHHHHHSSSAISKSTNASALADGSDKDKSESNCQHCGQCEEHCSAVLITALPQQQARPGAEHLICANAGRRAGFSYDLSRPPRTPSL